MFTADEVKALAPLVVARVNPDLPVAAYPAAPVIWDQLVGEDPEFPEGYIQFDHDGIWFMCGNQDRFLRYDAYTAPQVVDALVTLYKAWGVSYDFRTGFSL